MYKNKSIIYIFVYNSDRMVYFLFFILLFLRETSDFVFFILGKVTMLYLLLKQFSC